MLKLMILLPLLILCGCSWSLTNKGNVLAVDQLGTVVDLQNGDSCQTEACDQAHINQLMTGEGPILIYIHGGLNTKTASNRRVDELVPLMTGYRPIFINWKSGFITSYKEHLFNDRQGDYWTFWGYPSSPFIMAEDIGRGIVRAPMVWWYQINSFAQSVFFGVYPGEKNAARVNATLLKQQHGFGAIPSAVDENGSVVDKRNTFDKAFGNTLGFAKTSLGLVTAPIFDSFGTGAWDAMKRRIDVSFAKAKGRGFETWRDVDAYTDERKGAITLLFNRLNQQEPKRKVILVGHSMGAIVASNILRQWPDLNYEKIIFLAAACSIEDFQTAIAPLLKDKSRGIKFYNYMLHPIAENQEAHGFGLFGTGSLLNQIDNIYENARSENKRTLGRWLNVMNGINFFNVPGKNRIFLKTMPLDSEHPTRHGEFDEVRYNDHFGKRFWEEGFGQ